MKTVAACAILLVFSLQNVAPAYAGTSIATKHADGELDQKEIVDDLDDYELGSNETVEKAPTGETALYLPKTANGVQVLEDLGKGRFQVVPETGIAYRNSKNLHDRHAALGLDQNQIVAGIDEGEWVKIDDAATTWTALYLPKKANDVQILKDLGNGRYQVVPETGVAYRNSKNLQDRHADRGLDQNDIVDGIDDGEWVRIDMLDEATATQTALYLPMTIRGVQVLRNMGKGRFQVVPQTGVAYRNSKNLEDRHPDRGLDHNQIVVGVDEGGWVKIEQSETTRSTIEIIDKAQSAETAVYLPKMANGVQILKDLGQGRFQVVPATGVAYRNTKNLHDRHAHRGLDQYDTVDGVDEGEWVKIVAGVFLPKSVDGVQILASLGHGTFKVVPANGVAFRFSKNLDDRDGDRGLNGNQIFNGVDEDMWVRVTNVIFDQKSIGIEEYYHQKTEL